MRLVLRYNQCSKTIETPAFSRAYRCARFVYTFAKKAEYKYNHQFLNCSLLIFKSDINDKNKAAPIGTTLVMELLARFELATSSLPTILEQFLPCASYRKLLDKNLVCQRLFGLAYRCLL